MTTVATTHERAYSGPRLVRLVVTAGAVPVLCALIAVGLMLSWAPELPDPIAIHWGANGRADGFGSLGSLLILVAAIVTVFAGAVTLSLAWMPAVDASSSRHQPRFLGAMSVWIGVFLSIAMGGSVAVQRGFADATDVGTIVAPMVTGVAVGLAAAVVAWFVIPAPAIAEDSANGETHAMSLTADERVSWTASVRPRAGLVLLFAVLFAAMIVASGTGAAVGGGWTGWFIVGLLVFVLVVSVVTFFWRVTVTSGGFSVRTAGGVLGITVPLREITTARVVQINPLADFGGWGWRVTTGRTGIVLRAGDALQVERRSGRSVVVTVDDAATAAALITGLVDRRATA